MSIIDTLIYDRTPSDTARAAYLNGLWDPETGGWKGTDAELAEWLEGPKGAYNATDLNRVAAALQYLSDRLNGYGYAVTVSPKADWTVGDIPTQAQLQAYLKDVAAIRGALELFGTTPQVPEDMVGLTWQEANDIEKILADVEAVMDRVVSAMARSGAFTFWSGSVPIPCAGSDRGRTWAELDALELPWTALETADWYLLSYGNLEVAQ